MGAGIGTPTAYDSTFTVRNLTARGNVLTATDGGGVVFQVRNDGLIMAPYITDIGDDGPLFKFSATDIQYVARGAVSNLGLWGSSYGGGVQVAFVANATTAPTTNPVGGGVLFAVAGALKWRGSSGTVTTVAVA
jgi:hypothetical protein